MKLKETELENQLMSLNNEIEATDLQGNNLLTDKDSTIFNLTNQVNELESGCGIITEKNKDITIEIKNLNDEINKYIYDTEKIKKESSTKINNLNHTINGNDMNLNAYVHDSECQLLSRDEMLRSCEDTLQNLHEDRISREKELNDIIENLKIKIEEKDQEHETYATDDDKQKFLLDDNNKAKDVKIKDLEDSLIQLNKMLYQTKTDLENNIVKTNNDVISKERELSGN